MEPPSSPDAAYTGGMSFPSVSPGGETEVIVDDIRWRARVPNAEAIVRRALTAATADGGAVPETVMLSSDRVVKRLNMRHRGRNKPTNVLTFEPPLPGLGGEIVLALETVCREAASAGRTPAAHLAHLVVHGVLHLDGYDHHQAGEARQMEMEETRILSRIGIACPWKSRMTTRGA